jgi:hypothetical protein
MNAATRRWRNLSVRKKILLGFLPVLLLTALSAAAVLFQAVQIGRYNAELERTARVLSGAIEIEGALVDRTLWFRDFLLSGEESALLEFDAAQERLDSVIDTTRDVTQDESQRLRLDTIADFSQRWMDSVAQPGNRAATGHVAARRPRDGGGAGLLPHRRGAARRHPRPRRRLPLRSPRGRDRGGPPAATSSTRSIRCAPPRSSSPSSLRWRRSPWRGPSAAASRCRSTAPWHWRARWRPAT